ncbi:MAG: hypothetical protein R2909_11750 [Gemmatimonadales bacterium]
MKRALLSVSDKRGIVEFAKELVDLGYEIVSTGGTAAALRKADVPVTMVDSVTGFPEILDGRVKTLHPKIHAGLLARHDSDQHQTTLDAHGILPFHLVAVNLYPFQATIANPDVTFDDAIENIDIGGPSMLRSAAKNHQYVLPIVDPTDYPQVIAQLRQGEISLEARRGYAAKVFPHGRLRRRDHRLPHRRQASNLLRPDPGRAADDAALRENPTSGRAYINSEPPRDPRT